MADSLSRLLAPKKGALPELEALQRCVEDNTGRLRCRVLAEPRPDHPVLGIALGSEDPRAPLLCIVGGVHGVERIGAQVVLAILTTLTRQLAWDRVLQDTLTSMRVAILPLVNPVGMALHRRANGSGVDLMRNAPDSPQGWATPLVGGHRLSPRLPWYRGLLDAPMELEAQALCDFFEHESREASVVISVDVHSGFGAIDRLWFPYARTRKPIWHLPEVLAFGELLDDTLPNHIYHLEPQTRHYTAQGDLWDYLYDRYRARQPGGVFLPMTLEMGSWNWLRKNPRQLLSPLGSYNPFKLHRLQRTMRRHLSLFDFLRRCLVSSSAWLPREENRVALHRRAIARWY